MMTDDDDDRPAGEERRRLQGIDSELATVEQSLSAPQRGGRAVSQSIQCLLGSLRSRLETNTNGQELRRSLSERLRMAQLAHSARIPLSVLRSREQQEPEAPSSPHTGSPSASASASASNEQPRGRQVPRRSLLARKTQQSDRSVSSSSDTTRSVPQRRSSYSVLVASRHRADHAGGFPLLDERDFSFGGSMRNLVSSPISTSSLVSPEQSHEEETHLDPISETPILLSKSGRESFSRRSGGFLSGSVRQLSVEKSSGSDSVVYSWGCGVQSLHDDMEEKVLIDASLSGTSRLGKPGAKAVLSVATSATHTACATAQGEVYVCGMNPFGEVDPSGGKDMVVRPTLLESLMGQQVQVVQVSCGLHHTAALTANGSILTWGSNNNGQLGHTLGSSTSHVFPKGFVMGRGRRAAAVACGDSFTLCLTTRLSVLCAGIPEIAGSYGAGPTRSLPALEGLPIVSVAAGKRHAIVLTAHGTALAWGNNSSGCCGRPFPTRLGAPSIMAVPDTQQTFPNNTPKKLFPNWANWDINQKNRGVSLASDVAVSHAACGNTHTVLVTRSGRLLVCGRNDQGQLGLPKDEESDFLKPVNHPEVGKHYVTAEAGDGFTLMLDNVGNVYQMGHGTSTVKCVLSNKAILTIAAGGNSKIALASGSTGSLCRQVSVSFDTNATMPKNLEDLLDAISTTSQSSHEGESTKISSAGQELASQTEELLRYPEVLNSLFLDPFELDHLYQGLVGARISEKDRQAIGTAMEKGIKLGLERLISTDARMIYPEAVRCLLLYIVFFDQNDGEVVFDASGECIVLLCESILDLSFEGYKALLTWVMTIYPRDLFVRMLIQPLLVQLEKGLKSSVDENGVDHPSPVRNAVPLIVTVLRWFNKASDMTGVEVALAEDFYSKAVEDLSMTTLYQDMVTYKQANHAQRSSHFFWFANPFLMSPGTKRNLMETECQVEMYKLATSDAKYDAETHEIKIDPFFPLEIERDHLMEHTLAKIKATKGTDLRKKLRVIFKDEEGVDAGGVTREFFQLLSQDLFDVNSSLWTTQYGDQITWFNSDCTWDNDGYELVGILVGLALYNSVLLDVHFPMAVYRKLLGLSLGLEDMVDEELKKGLRLLLDYEGDDVEDVFCLTFEVSWMDLGKEQNVELKPGGSNISVTSDNREEYVLLYVEWVLIDSIQEQWDAFEKGLMRIMEDSITMDLFRPEELKLLVVGSPELDFKALEANTTYEGGYDKDSAVVRNFWRFVMEASVETQLNLLKFATGSSMAPIGGLGELDFKIQRAGPDSPQLPTSHTCFNTLLLPDYGDSYEKLRERLARSILECEGFGLQ